MKHVGGGFVPWGVFVIACALLQLVRASSSSSCGGPGTTVDCVPTLRQVVLASNVASSSSGSGISGSNSGLDFSTSLGTDDSSSSSSSGLSGTFSSIMTSGTTQTEAQQAMSCASSLSSLLSDFNSMQTTLTRVNTSMSDLLLNMQTLETSAQSVLSGQAEYAASLVELAKLMTGAESQTDNLQQWTSGEDGIRSQLTTLYQSLETFVNGNSDELIQVNALMRKTLANYQMVHDHAAKVITAVGDAQTNMYQWSFNVSSTINTHAQQITDLTQTLSYRSAQENSIVDSVNTLQWVFSQLASIYGAQNVSDASAKLMAGSLSVQTVAPGVAAYYMANSTTEAVSQASL